MAQNQSPAFFAVALLILAAAAPLALAQLPLQPAILFPNAIQINGTLCCTPTGICSGGSSGLAGVNYTMSCSLGALGSGSGSLVVARGVTGVNGQFSITLSIVALLRSLGITINDLLAGNLPCRIIIDLPVDQILCPALGAVNGVLTGVISLLGTAISAVLGLVLTFGVNFVIAVPLP